MRAGWSSQARLTGITFGRIQRAFVVPPNTSDNETLDAAQVDQALAALAAGDSATAETLLLNVIANTPTGYTNSSEDRDGGISIKFWNLETFTHYIMWQRQLGRDRNARWVSNAYPRAHYFMGFLCVKTGRHEEALGYLERGQELEPTNPLFNLERAQALAQSGEKQRALECYEAVTDMGPFVTAFAVGVAWRGRGSVLVELGRLEEAEAAYRSSLGFDPENPIAFDELRYIEHLRQGGSGSPGRVVATLSPDLSKCAVCEESLGQGVVMSVRGQPRIVCDVCQRRRARKWWRFWT